MAPEETTPSADMSFHDLGLAAIAGIEDPAPDAGQAEDTAPAEESADTPTADDKSVEAPTEPEGTPEKAEETTSEEFLPLDLRGYDRDTIPKELQPTYDRLVEAYKSMQAGLTPKLQAGAEAQKAADALALQVETLTSKLEALTTTQQKPDGNDPTSFLYNGLQRISWDDVKKSDDPDLYAKWVTEQAVIEGRRAANEALAALVGVLNPRLVQVESTVSDFTTAQYQAEVKVVDAFFDKNSDVEPYRGDIATLIEAGIASDIEDGAEKVRAIRFGPQREAKVLAAALEAAKVKQADVAGKQDQFSVPAASTSPKGAPRFTADMSFKDIARAAVADLG